MSSQPPSLASNTALPNLSLSPEASGFGTGAHPSRVALRAAVARRSVENLALNKATNEVVSSYRPHAEVVQSAIREQSFLTYLDRALQKHLGAQYEQLMSGSSERSTLLEALREAAIAITDRAARHFDAQRAHPRFNPAKDVTPYNTYTPPSLTAQVLEPFLAEHVAAPKLRPQLIGGIRHALKDAVSATLVVEGYTKREDDGQRSIANVSALYLSYLQRPELGTPDAKKPVGPQVKNEGLGPRPPPAQFSAICLGRAAKHQDPAKVRDFLLAIEEVPEMKNTALRDQVTGQTTRRLQRALADLLVRHPAEPLSREHLATVEIFKRILSDDSIRFHPHHYNNDAAVVDAIFNGLKAGSITLAAASCPDYSGSYVGAGKERVWSYDFRSLGTGPGHVAARGFAYVKAWHAVLSREEFFGPNVDFVHWEGTFEVAEGFKGKGPQGEQLTHAEAVARLQRSGLAVAELYQAAGIRCTPRLTSESIPDDEFLRRKVELGSQILEQSAVDHELHKLLETLAHRRFALYREWFPPREGEDEHHYAARIAREIAPVNVAEYQLLGQILRGSATHTLVLAYDSPNMAEVYARLGLPVISGQDKSATSYMGA